jgi:hypothetical protein
VPEVSSAKELTSRSTRMDQDDLERQGAVGTTSNEGEEEDEDEF